MSVNSIKFTGLASGLDTQSIVDSLMKVQRMPLDKLKQKKQILEWQRDNYRTMNAKLKEFDTFIFEGISKQSNMMKRTAVSSNKDIVSVSAKANAGNVSYNISDVVMAKSAKVQSADKISNSTLDPTKSLLSQQSKLTDDSGIQWKGESFSQTLTGQGDEIYLSGTSLSGFPDSITVTGGTDKTFKVQLIEGDAPEKGTRAADTVYVNPATGKMTFGEILPENSTVTVSGDNLKKNSYIEFDIQTTNEDGTKNKQSFKIDGSTSLNSMFSKINSSNVGISMFYDTGTDKVVAQRTDTGILNNGAEEIEFLGKDAEFFTKTLNLTEKTAGSDAEFTINGLKTSRKSNTFTMNDVTFNLNKNTAAGESVNVNIQTDTDSIFDTIKSFVDKYNETIGAVNTELTAQRYSAFQPLTEEQKAAMGEKEIEQWEEKAKSGLLKRDPLLTSGLNKMRNSLYASVTVNDKTKTIEKYNQLAEIGITTSKDYLERGKLEINEEKLRAAIEDNPEAVYQLFMADGPTTDQQGLARRLRTDISDTMKQIEEKAGNTFKTEYNYTIGKDMLRIDDNIESMEYRLKQIEDRYWSQYNAMEKAIQKLNNQSSQLAGFFAQNGS
ncbi:flagellar filament capping protein FliD [Niallia circulans]|uniref:flagellar filament capping protein FliD n=1 Tax=Niallia circulans TaxID=1397 RepID=UPI00156067EB|nr:flagellar filament capping protein FliD [Niallia circulans]NRG33228.1 flagellar filament capping protein FliD [Niallia circulans]